MLQRWSKLERDFRQKSGRYDISKIPDIYDCVKYDVQHNGSLGLQGTAELLRLSKALADVVIPQVCLIKGLSRGSSIEEERREKVERRGGLVTRDRNVEEGIVATVCKVRSNSGKYRSK